MDPKILRLVAAIALIAIGFGAGFVVGGAVQEAHPFIKRPGSMSSGQ